MPTPKTPTAFTDTLADILRLPDETLAMSYLYLNKHNRYFHTSPTPSPLDPYTLALATLSLASKSTESPRRLRAILLPAHRLLHPPPSESKPQPNTLAAPLTIPSETYDALRATLVQAELLLLRVLGFELRIASPMDYLGRYLERAMEGVEGEEGYEAWWREERYEAWVREEKMEFGVEEGGWRGMRVGRGVWRWGVRACKNYNLSNLFPARAVALGCVHTALLDHSLSITEALPTWVNQISSSKVDLEDFQEVIDELQKPSTQ